MYDIWDVLFSISFVCSVLASVPVPVAALQCCQCSSNGNVINTLRGKLGVMFCSFVHWQLYPVGRRHVPQTSPATLPISDTVFLFVSRPWVMGGVNPAGGPTTSPAFWLSSICLIWIGSSSVQTSEWAFWDKGLPLGLLVCEMEVTLASPSSLCYLL